MRNNKSVINVLSIVIVASIMLAANFVSPTFAQNKASNDDGNNDGSSTDGNNDGSVSDGSSTDGNDLGNFKYVKKFDSDGNYIAGWGSKGTGDGQFLHHHGICLVKSSP